MSSRNLIEQDTAFKRPKNLEDFQKEDRSKEALTEKKHRKRALPKN